MYAPSTQKVSLVPETYIGMKMIVVSVLIDNDHETDYSTLAAIEYP